MLSSPCILRSTHMPSFHLFRAVPDLAVTIPRISPFPRLQQEPRIMQNVLYVTGDVGRGCPVSWAVSLFKAYRDTRSTVVD